MFASLSYGAALTLAICVLFALYHKYWRVSSRAPESQDRKVAKRWTKAREKVRLATYPGPYPNTWYALFRSEEIPAGAVKDKHACGVDLVVFRRSDGKPAVLDAYCPHMGAHLGFASVVKDDCIRCPFHHWTFDSEGTCTSIPYTDKPIPPGAKVHAWPVKEWGGSIYFFYHENREPPTFELPDLSQELNRMVYRGWQDLHYNMHVMEMMENCSDPVHFQTVHGIPDVPIIRNYVHLQHNITCEHDGPLVKFTNKPRAIWNSTKKPTPLSDFAEVYITFVGPSIVVFRFLTKYWGDALFVKCSLPVEPLSQHIVDVVYSDPKMPWWVVKFLKIQSINGFEEDKPIWEHKIGRSKPLLVSGDGKIMLRRAWFRQFYANSHW
jgi:nitrite reductase/ring-hydroxylating ferredoxin subunit